MNRKLNLNLFPQKNNMYSLTIETNGHADMTTFAYESGGNFIDLTIYDMDKKALTKLQGLIVYAIEHIN
jgi:hypothetical protein